MEEKSGQNGSFSIQYEMLLQYIKNKKEIK